MKLLLLHSDFIEFEAISKAVKTAEEIERKKVRVEECLVAFASVEKGDEDAVAVAKKASGEIIKVASQVKTGKIVLYPFVHLSQNPSSLGTALEVLKEIEKEIKTLKGYTIVRAPFGWYKSFDIKCKGHPLSELSRQVTIGDGKMGKESASLKAESKLESKFFIMDIDGSLVPADKFNYSKYPKLKKLKEYEMKKVRAYDKEPPHIRLMREHELVGIEPGSDSGNLRWYPKGRLVKKILERKITQMCVGNGAMEVETPIMYDYEHPSLKKYLDRFPARQYVVQSDDKEYFLRFAACFGQFLIAHDTVFTYKDLPMKMYELTKYSFRREQSGEVAGLRRLRAFSMPDMHTFCANSMQAKEEFERQFELSLEWNKDLGIPIEAAFRIQEDWHAKNKEWYVKLVKKLGKPVLVEMFAQRYAYFITKFEFNVIDNLGKGSALSTVQIDVENADTYDISYIDEKGEKKRPLILHASLSGSIDRVIYAILENEAEKRHRGEVAMFPVFLSPTQIRIVPVSSKQNEYCKKLLEKCAGKDVRIDFDDRDETLQKKIRFAEKEWVPFIAVVGEREMESGKLSVRIRGQKEQSTLSLDELVSLVLEKCSGQPFEPLNMPPVLSKRPIFAK